MEDCPKCKNEMVLGVVGTREYWVCDPCKIKFPKCEVYSRVCGYLRPVAQYNKGKVQEFNDRLDYKVKLT